MVPLDYYQCFEFSFDLACLFFFCFFFFCTFFFSSTILVNFFSSMIFLSAAIEMGFSIILRNEVICFISQKMFAMHLDAFFFFFFFFFVVVC